MTEKTTVVENPTPFPQMLALSPIFITVKCLQIQLSEKDIMVSGAYPEMICF